MQTPRPRPTGLPLAWTLHHSSNLRDIGWHSFDQRVESQESTLNRNHIGVNHDVATYFQYIYIQITDLYSTNRPCNVLKGPFGEVWVMLGNSRSFRVTGIWILHLFLLFWWFDSSHVCHITKWCQIWSILIHSFHLLLILWVNMTTFETHQIIMVLSLWWFSAMTMPGP